MEKEKMPATCRQTAWLRMYPYMDLTMANQRNDTDEDLLRRASRGDEAALAALFGRYRKRLQQMVRLRLDRRLQGRVDPSDVLQEAYLDVAQQLPHYLKKPEMSFFLWLRVVTGQRLIRVHRQHLGAAARDAGREVSLYRGALPQARPYKEPARPFARIPLQNRPDIPRQGNWSAHDFHRRLIRGTLLSILNVGNGLCRRC
jgi:DNA-directed RNA polymerase specialized sigma24 family protein